VKKEGPLLEDLTRRLAETPPDFLEEPRIKKSGKVHVDAVVHDLLLLQGAAVAPTQLAAFSSGDTADRNRLTMTLILCHLLSNEWFLNQKIDASALLALLNEGATELAGQMQAGKAITDPDRREEVVRFSLSRLGYRPAGETEAQAEDRLASLNSAERARVMAASRKAEARARAIREALAKKAAEESADKWTRE
jgi:hypothetical protein